MFVNKENRFSHKDFLFTFAFLIYSFRELYNASQYSMGFEEPEFFRFIYFSLIMGLLITVIIIDKGYSNHILLVGVLAVFMMTILVSGRVRELLIIGMFIVAAENIHFDKMIKVLVVFMSIYILVICILDYMDVFNVYQTIFENVNRYTDNGIVVRGFMGFDYPTKVPNFFMSIVMMICYCRRDKTRSLLLAAILLVINYVIYRITDTRAIYYEIILFVVGVYGIKWVDSVFGIKLIKIKLIRILSVMAFPIYILVSLYFGFKYDAEIDWMYRINNALSNRFHLTKKAIAEFGIHPFGSRFDWRIIGYRGTDRFLFVDCSYWNIIIRYGVVLFVLVIILFEIIMIDSVRNEEAVLTWILVIVGLHACTDPQLLSLMYTPFILLSFGVMKRITHFERKSFI